MAKKFRKTITLPDGKRKDIYANSKSELIEKELGLRMLARAGVNISDNITFEEYARQWYLTYKEPSLKPKSREAIQNTLSHITPRLGHLNMRDILPVHILDVMNGLSTYSRSLNSKALQCLRQIFDSAVDNNIIVKSPVPLRLKAKGAATTEKEALTKQQEETLLSALEGTRAYLFCLLALRTGLRRGEILGLMWDCVDFEERLIRVRRNLVFSDEGEHLEDDLKTAAGRREVPMTEEVARILRRERANTNSLFVFHMSNGAHLTRSSFRSLWARVAVRQAPNEADNKHPWVDRSLDFDVTPHQLRHTYATRCFESGLDVKEVQYLLGHASPDITMRIYIHYTKSQRKEETFTKARAAMAER